MSDSNVFSDQYRLRIPERIRRVLHDNLTLPMFGAPMLIPCQPELTIAQCQAGIVGAFPALSARPSAQLEDWLYQIEESLRVFRKENPDRKIGPYAINQIVRKSNVRLEQDMEICIKHKVPIVITSIGARPDVVKAVQGYGGIVFHDVTTMHHVDKALEHGVDGLVLLCAGAGGHGGHINPFAFVAEVRRYFKGMVAVAGCITNGRALAAARILGADFGYVGTRFVATPEARSLAQHKQLITESSADDIIYTPKINGILCNWLKPSLIRAGLNIDDLQTPDLELGPDHDVRNVYKDLWPAGQGVGDIDAIEPVSVIVSRFGMEYAQALKALQAGRLIAV